MREKSIYFDSLFIARNDPGNGWWLMRSYFIASCTFSRVKNISDVFLRKYFRPRWQRMPTSHVFYHRSPAHNNAYVLSFAFCFDKENETYQFAMCQPFTYSRHKVMLRLVSFYFGLESRLKRPRRTGKVCVQSWQSFNVNNIRTCSNICWQKQS